MAKIGQFEQKSRIIPNPDGTGNEVFLKSLPYFDPEDKYPKVHFVFVDETNAEFDYGLLDPFDATSEKIRDGGFARLLHLYGSFMPSDVYETQLKEYDPDKNEDDNIGPFIEFANGLVAEDVLDIPFKALIAYNKSGYLAFPAVGDVISSKYKPKTLQHNPASNTTLKPVAKPMDEEKDNSSSTGNDM